MKIETGVLAGLYSGGFTGAGDDIDDFNVDGKWDASAEVSVDVKRYEAKLSDILELLLADFMRQYNSGRNGEPGYAEDSINMAMLYRAVCELLLEHGPLSAAAVDRYYAGMLDDVFSDSLVQDRFFYLTTTINISAGQTITVKANSCKEGSFDFACSGSENRGIYGYDMLTKIGSGLIFDSISARPSIERIEIIRQNFGFDPANGILNVTLDPEVSHYFLKVRGIAGDK